MEYYPIFPRGISLLNGNKLKITKGQELFLKDSAVE